MILQNDGSSKSKVLIASLLFMGLAHILFFKQYLKGAFFAVIQVIMLINLPGILRTLYGMITLGEPNPYVPVTQRDHSTFMLIEGVAMLAIVGLILVLYYISVKSALKTYSDYCVTGRLTKNRDSIKELFNSAFPVFGLAPSLLLVVFFIVVPLVFAALVSFTNFSSPFNLPPGNTVDWVGLDNYIQLFSGETLWTGALVRVAFWTLAWAFFATITCYFGGMFMSVILKDFHIKFVSFFFRLIFILPYAIPAIISMMVWRNLLHGFGPVNRTLIHFGLIEETLPFLTSVTFVRFTVILVNLWAGFPYFMLLTMGSMSAINSELYEAARIDGASKFNLFRYITFPLVTFQIMPLIIMSFTHNVNNFGAIYFLTGGSPAVADTPLTSATGVDILITWIYRLTIDTRQYHFAAVLAVMIFVILAPFAVFQFMRTKSFKEGEL